MDYDDYLTSQGVPELPQDSGPSTAPPSDSQPQGAQDTPLSGLTVAPDPSTQQGINYSAPDIQASQDNLKQAMQSPSMQAPGGSANPGIWGLLPQGMQHGTLRNVLGALGDAFLVGSGHNATYGPNMQRQQEGLAMASYPDHPEISRGLLGATGAPDAMKDVVSLQENQNNMDLHKDQLAAQTQYRQDRQASTDANNKSLAAARTNTRLQGMMPQIGGMVSRATDLPSYTAAYNRADAIAKRIDPNSSADDFGLARPEEWTPGMVQGTTAGQQVASSDRGKGRTTTERGQDLNYKGRIGAAGISAYSKLPTEASQVDAIRQKVNAGQPLSAGDQKVWDKQTNVKGGTKLHDSTTDAAGPGAAGARGTAPPAAVAMLKSNPALRAQFEAKYGPASKYLGK